MFTRLQYLYWRIVPYNWRPGQLWYQFKCWSWKRYSTVRPRWLPHTWVDRDVLLAHCMFEVLGRFLEGECGDDGIVDWDADEAHRTAMAELRELWRWWAEDYLKFDRADLTAGLKAPEWTSHETEDGFGFRIEFRHESPEAEAAWTTAILKVADSEAEMEAELKRRMKRLVDVSSFMWT